MGTQRAQKLSQLPQQGLADLQPIPYAREQVRRVLLLARLEIILHLVQRGREAVQVFLAVEGCFLEVFAQPRDGRGHAVHGGGFIVAADGHEEERDELQGVVEDGVDAVLDQVVGPADLVEQVDLLDDFVVEGDDILGFDVGALVLFEQEQFVSNEQETV